MTTTWDVLNRQTGRVVLGGVPSNFVGEISNDEVAYCRETGEVVYR